MKLSEKMMPGYAMTEDDCDEVRKAWKAIERQKVRLQNYKYFRYDNMTELRHYETMIDSMLNDLEDIDGSNEESVRNT